MSVLFVRKPKAVKEVSVPAVPVVKPVLTPLLPVALSAFERWFQEHVSHDLGETFAVVGVNTLPRLMTHSELRAAIRHLQGIDAAMENVSCYVRSLSC